MATTRAPSLRALLRADLLARYPGARSWSPWRIALRFLSDPSLQAVLTVRLVHRSPGRLLFLWRTWNIARYRMEIFRFEAGPGLQLPDPLDILVGPGTKLGSDVTIHRNVNIGFDRAPSPGQRLPCPTIGDRVVIGAGSIVVGPVTIGSDARLEPGAFVTRDVAPGSVVKADPAWTEPTLETDPA
jgi:serine O-acetyltransferase